MKLSEIASRITAHLKRFERDKVINASPAGTTTFPYWMASACASGRFVYVTYVSYQGQSHLSRREAERYLAWLDAGNVGTHYAMPKVSVAQSSRETTTARDAQTGSSKEEVKMTIARITCDGFGYSLPEGEHTGANLRAFFGVDDDHDLWGERDKDDALIPDEQVAITVEDGARFHTAAKKING